MGRCGGCGRRSSGVLSTPVSCAAHYRYNVICLILDFLDYLSLVVSISFICLFIRAYFPLTTSRSHFIRHHTLRAFLSTDFRKHATPQCKHGTDAWIFLYNPPSQHHICKLEPQLAPLMKLDGFVATMTFGLSALRYAVFVAILVHVICRPGRLLLLYTMYLYRISSYTRTSGSSH